MTRRAARAHAGFWKCAATRRPSCWNTGRSWAGLVYEHMDQAPQQLYGAGIKSNYQGQGLKLSKHFRA